MLVPEEHDERRRELSEAKTMLTERGITVNVVERRGDAVTMARPASAERPLESTLGLACRIVDAPV